MVCVIKAIRIKILQGKRPGVWTYSWDGTCKWLCLWGGVGMGYCNSWIKTPKLKGVIGRGREFQDECSGTFACHNRPTNLRLTAVSIHTAKALETTVITGSLSREYLSHWVSRVTPLLRPEGLNQLSWEWPRYSSQQTCAWKWFGKMILASSQLSPSN